MSQSADIIATLQDARKRYGLTKSQTVELYVNILGDLEWDIDGVDYKAEDWREQEYQAAHKVLFGKSA